MDHQVERRGAVAACELDSSQCVALGHPSPYGHHLSPLSGEQAAADVATLIAERTVAVRAALIRLDEIERQLSHARYALRDIVDPAHPRHLSVIDARDTAYSRVQGAAYAVNLLVDEIGNLPSIDPDPSQGSCRV